MNVLPSAAFNPVASCWICGGTDLRPIHDLPVRAGHLRHAGPGAGAVHGPAALRSCRCAGCGFAQPAALPALPRYFDRMYDQRWSQDWIRNEFEASYKDDIFHGILGALARRLPATRRQVARRRGARRPLRVARAGRGLGRRRARAESPDRRLCRREDRRVDPPVERPRRRCRYGGVRRDHRHRRPRAHPGSRRACWSAWRRCSHPEGGWRSKCRAAPAS